MPKIDLSTGDPIQRNAINLEEETILGTRPTTAMKSPIMVALETIKGALYQDEKFDHKWENKDAILSRVRLMVQEQKLLEREKNNLIQMISDDLFGFGILEKYRQDASITEIIVDGPKNIMVEKGGILYDVPETFTEAQALDDWFFTHIMTMGDGDRHFDEQNPILDMETKDGERIHANRPPVTETVTVNIRKSAQQTQYFTSKDWVNHGSASPEMMDFLIQATAGKQTILVLGPTGSGKTTLVRTLIEEGVDDAERVLFIEDTRETNARKKRFLSLQTSDKPYVPMTELFKGAMRMRPDRICVSEIRGSEAAPFLLTTAAGHPGPITTMHAGNPARAVFLLMVYLKRSGEMDMSEEFLQRFIHEQVHIMVFISRLKDGRRRITEIAEVNAAGNFTILFEWDPMADNFQATNSISEEKQRDILVNKGGAVK